MVHQRGNSLFLLLSRSIAIVINHIGPIIGGGTEIGILLAIQRCVIAVLSRSRHRPFPILHQLCHCRGHATCRTTSRNIHIERRALVPTLLNQGLNNRKAFVGMQITVGLKVLPLGDDVVRNGTALFHHGNDTFRDFIQHKTQSVRSAFISEITLVGIAEDG